MKRHYLDRDAPLAAYAKAFGVIVMPVQAQQRPPFSTRTTEEWRQYFLDNADALLEIPWDAGVSFTPEECDDLAASIQEFQLGESSEGKHIIRQAQAYAQQSGDVAYPHTLALFIAEEHRHARDLGRVLDLAGIPRAAHAWPDTVFRWLRHRAGLELSIAVLVTAEIIAKVYYAALREATASPVLRRLCEQICSDEIAHVEFQTHRLSILRRVRSPLARATLRFIHRIFYAGTCLVVWHKHGRAMRRGGFDFRRFWRAAHAEFAEALDRCDPRRYAPANPSTPAADTAKVGRAHPFP
jgi:hypothetical protein